MKLPTLADWLARLERLHPKGIDLGLDRVRVVADRLALRLDAPTFIVGGTNGKGSTCAMLDSILRAGGYRTALYTSPHLLDFNERARIDGANVSDAALVEQFEAVEAARSEVSLTYFEFTTLAILRLFAAARLDAAVLEIGLGGRLDAVNLIDADVSIVTSVDLDHMEYLGPTREEIGFEKAHIYRPGRPAICSDPHPPQSLLDHAQAIGADLWRFGSDFNYQGDRQQWAYGGRHRRRSGLPYPALRGANQLLNAAGVLAALEALEDRLPVSQQAVRQGLLTVELPARFQVLPGRPTTILDVAHNPHAAAVLAENLDNMGFYPVTHAVFGMLRDKDIGAVAARLGPRVDHWHIGSTPGPRGSSAAEAAAIVRRALGGPKLPSITEHDSVADAYASARERAGADDRILAFGSFLTVADVMRVMRAERLPGA
ncbi:MAG TPA: bifunctional tetrahydrofolate synthase/dihydrofolate synthase [Burkholderiaceae bacterium]|nr:bifunctional tetrahydrofolate synthase/dihydrofolate synthase [Burkholderiaceae bacterium]